MWLTYKWEVLHFSFHRILKITLEKEVGTIIPQAQDRCMKNPELLGLGIWFYFSLEGLSSGRFQILKTFSNTFILFFWQPSSTTFAKMFPFVFSLLFLWIFLSLSSFHASPLLLTLKASYSYSVSPGTQTCLSLIRGEASGQPWGSSPGSVAPPLKSVGIALIRWSSPQG